jgi:hypothetical protein
MAAMMFGFNRSFMYCHNAPPGVGLGVDRGALLYSFLFHQD